MGGPQDGANLFGSGDDANDPSSLFDALDDVASRLQQDHEQRVAAGPGGGGQDAKESNAAGGPDGGSRVQSGHYVTTAIGSEQLHLENGDTSTKATAVLTNQDESALRELEEMVGLVKPAATTPGVPVVIDGGGGDGGDGIAVENNEAVVRGYSILPHEGEEEENTGKTGVAKPLLGRKGKCVPVDDVTGKMRSIVCPPHIPYAEAHVLGTVGRKWWTLHRKRATAKAEDIRWDSIAAFSGADDSHHRGHRGDADRDGERERPGSTFSVSFRSLSQQVTTIRFGIGTIGPLDMETLGAFAIAQHRSKRQWLHERKQRAGSDAPDGEAGPAAYEQEVQAAFNDVFCSGTSLWGEGGPMWVDVVVCVQLWNGGIPISPVLFSNATAPSLDGTYIINEVFDFDVGVSSATSSMLVYLKVIAALGPSTVDVVAECVLPIVDEGTVALVQGVREGMLWPPLGCEPHQLRVASEAPCPALWSMMVMKDIEEWQEKVEGRSIAEIESVVTSMIPDKISGADLDTVSAAWSQVQSDTKAALNQHGMNVERMRRVLGGKLSMLVPGWESRLFCGPAARGEATELLSERDKVRSECVRLRLALYSCKFSERDLFGVAGGKSDAASGVRPVSWLVSSRMACEAMCQKLEALCMLWHLEENIPAFLWDALHQRGASNMLFKIHYPEFDAPWLVERKVSGDALVSILGDAMPASKVPLPIAATFSTQAGMGPVVRKTRSSGRDRDGADGKTAESGNGDAYSSNGGGTHCRKGSTSWDTASTPSGARTKAAAWDGVLFADTADGHAARRAMMMHGRLHIRSREVVESHHDLLKDSEFHSRDRIMRRLIRGVGMSSGRVMVPRSGELVTIKRVLARTSIFVGRCFKNQDERALFFRYAAWFKQNHASAISKFIVCLEEHMKDMSEDDLRTENDEKTRPSVISFSGLDFSDKRLFEVMMWRGIDLTGAMELLSYRFQDWRIRQMGAMVLWSKQRCEVIYFLNQLVYGLRYEPEEFRRYLHPKRHSSYFKHCGEKSPSLANFLIDCAVTDEYTAYIIYWSVITEVCSWTHAAEDGWDALEDGSVGGASREQSRGAVVSNASSGSGRGTVGDSSDRGGGAGVAAVDARSGSTPASGSTSSATQGSSGHAPSGSALGGLYGDAGLTGGVRYQKMSGKQKREFAYEVSVAGLQVEDFLSDIDGKYTPGIGRSDPDLPHVSTISQTAWNAIGFGKPGLQLRRYYNAKHPYAWFYRELVNVFNRVCIGHDRNSVRLREVCRNIKRQELFVVCMFGTTKTILSRLKAPNRSTLASAVAASLEHGKHPVQRVLKDGPLPFPFAGSLVRLHEVVAGKTHIFKSAIAPMRVTFMVSGYKALRKLGGEAGKAETPRSGAAGAMAGAVQLVPKSLIFKCGDDVRQDQVILSFISQIDFFLKKEKLDLRLTPYLVMPTSQHAGVMEVVDDCIPLSHIKNVVVKLQQDHGDPDAPETQFIRPKVMDNYVRSLAGYTLICYLLDIGDRHLDNIMLCKDGSIFHLDFGYAFGENPKPKALQPSVRLSDSMLAVLGKRHESKQFDDFVHICCEAYTILRNKAHFLMALLVQLIDTSLPAIQYSNRSTSSSYLHDVYSRFRMGLSSQQAKVHMKEKVILPNMGGIWSQVGELSHRLAQSLR